LHHLLTGLEKNVLIHYQPQITDKNSGRTFGDLKIVYPTGTEPSTRFSNYFADASIAMRILSEARGGNKGEAWALEV